VGLISEDLTREKRHVTAVRLNYVQLEHMSWKPYHRALLNGTQPHFVNQICILYSLSQLDPTHGFRVRYRVCVSVTALQGEEAMNSHLTVSRHSLSATLANDCRFVALYQKQHANEAVPFMNRDFYWPHISTFCIY
jgi:hypothetical protein